MREIRMLRAKRRGLETEPRTSLHGHEGGNSGHSQGVPYGPPRQPSTLPACPMTIHRLARAAGLSSDALRPSPQSAADNTSGVTPLSSAQ